jgi:uncharacterized membrane protein
VQKKRPPQALLNLRLRQSVLFSRRKFKDLLPERLRKFTVIAIRIVFALVHFTVYEGYQTARNDFYKRSVRFEYFKGVSEAIGYIVGFVTYFNLLYTGYELFRFVSRESYTVLYTKHVSYAFYILNRQIGKGIACGGRVIGLCIGRIRIERATEQRD